MIEIIRRCLVEKLLRGLKVKTFSWPGVQQPRVEAVGRNAESLGHVDHRTTPICDLSARFNLELVRVPLAAHEHLLKCQSVWLRGVYRIRGDSDVDLLLADLDDNGKLHILMIEAKFDGSWKWDQLASKLDRLTKVLKPINAATLNLQLLLAQPKKLRSPLTVHWDEEGRLPISWPKKGTKEGRRLEKALRTLQVSEGGRVNCLAGWEFSVEKVKAPTIPLRPGHLPIVAPSRTGKDHEELRFKSLHFVDPDTSC